LLAVVSGLVDLISLRGGVDVGGALTVIGCVFTVAVSTFGGWSGVLLQVLVAWSYRISRILVGASSWLINVRSPGM